MENAFYFTLKALFVLKIFKLSSWHFTHVGKRLDRKDKANFKIYDATTRLTNNCNTYFKKERQSDNKFGQLVECNMGNIFVEKSHAKCVRETIRTPFSKKSKLSISLDE